MRLKKDEIDAINQLIMEVGAKVKEHYRSNKVLNIDFKEDQSPVTEADMEASHLLVMGLHKIFPKIPVISEEDDYKNNLELLQNNSVIWLVDPIDGTKAFMNRNGDFTINISLLDKGIPIFGAIYHPLRQILYYTDENNIAYKKNRLKPESVIKVSKRERHDNLKAVISARSMNEASQEFHHMLSIKQYDQISSSLKFCLVAEGQYDLYANFSKMFLWDIAAGHAIINAAGGVILDVYGNILRYDLNTLLAPKFIACAAYLNSHIKSLLAKEIRFYTNF